MMDDNKMNFYESLVKNGSFAFVDLESLGDKNQENLAFVIKKYNKSFERIAGINNGSIAGKKLTHICPDFIDPYFDWIKFFNEILVNGEKKEVKKYFMTMDKWFRLEINPYTPKSLTIILTDISHEMTQFHDAQKKVAYFQQVLLSISDMLVSVNHRGEILDCNLGQDCNKELDQSRPKDFKYIFDDGTAKDLRLHIEKSLKENKKTLFEFQTSLKDGLDFYEAQIVPQGPEEALVLIHNINQRKCMENEIQESKRNLNQLFSQSTVGIFFMMLDQPIEWHKSIDREKILDYVFSHQRITRVNQAMLDQYKSTEEEFLGLTPHDFFEHDLLSGREVWKDLFDLGRLHIETKEKRFNGEDMYVLGDYICFYDDQNRITGHFGVQIDVTQQKMAEIKLKESEEQLRLALDATGEGIWDWDIEKNLISHNQRWYDILGMSKNTLEHPLDLFLDSIYEDDRPSVIKSVQVCLDHDVDYKSEHRMVKENGEIIWVLDRGQVVSRSQNGKALRMLGSISEITHKKVLEEQLKLTRDLFSSGPVFIVVWTVKEGLSLSYISDNVEDILGYKKSEIMAPSFQFRDIIHPKDYDPYINHIRDYIENKDMVHHFEQSYRIKLKNGEYAWFYDFSMLNRDENNKVKEIQGYLYDQSYQKKIEKDLEEKSFRLDSIINGTNVGTWEWNVQTGQTSFNERWAQIIGYNLDEIQPTTIDTWMKLGHPDDLKSSSVALEKHFSGELTYYDVEARMLHKNGEWIWVHDRGKVATWTEDGKPLMMYGTHQDISEAKENERKVQRFSALQQIILKISKDFINADISKFKDLTHAALEEIGRFVSADRAYIFYYNFEANTTSNAFEWCEEGISKEIDNLQDVPLDYIPDWISTHERRKALYVYDVSQLDQPEEQGLRQILEPQGIQSIYTLPLFKKDKLIGFIGFDSVREKHKYAEKEKTLLSIFGEMFVNFSQRVKTSEKLKIAAEQARSSSVAKSEFLANMSHEIRTPMNAVLGFSEILRGEIEDEKLLSYVEGIGLAGKNLLSLINDILDLSKIEAGHMTLSLEEVRLKFLLKEMMDLFQMKADEKGIDLICEYDESLSLLILIDEVRVKQILLNLIGNAIKFTAQGMVNIKADIIYLGEARLDIAFTIGDTGIGIPKNQHHKIFESFTQQDGQNTRKYGGTGLGLAISKKLATMMGGHIELESKVGQGSKFSLILNDVPFKKISPYDPDTSSKEEKNLEYVFEPSRILIAEDIYSNIEVLLGHLKKYNFEFFISDNGKDALEKAKLYQPDLILMDMQMPLMSGYEVTKILKEEPETKNIIIIAVTASVMKNDELKIRDLCDGYLRKPFTKNDLLLELSKHLNHKIVRKIPKAPHQNLKALDHKISKETRSELKSLFMEKWTDINQLKIGTDIQDFALEVLDFARERNIENLIKYGQKLYDYADNYDIEKSEGLFSFFYEILMGSEDKDPMM